MKEFWKYWKLRPEEDRHVWRFAPPAEKDFPTGSERDWETPRGKRFLEAMSRDFLFDKSANPNSADRLYRHQALESPHPPPATATVPEESGDPLADQAFLSTHRGIDFYRRLQRDDGHWPGDYGGPHFLLPGLVIASHITGAPFPPPHQTLMKRYMYNHQNDDGGWGLHLEGASVLFTTVLQYVALRLLGEDPGNAELTRAREWILSQGGATGIPPWGKFYLSVLGVYAWEGNHSLMPEMWLLPRFLPVHPWRYWCHCRMVYLPMSYCFGHRVTASETEVTRALRQELYPCDYAAIDWRAARDRVARTDLFHPPSPLLKTLNVFLDGYESIHLRPLRKRALKFILEYIDAEDRQTEYIDIGPVNQVINSICIWHAHGKDSPQFRKHVERWADYLWVAEDGMKMNGYNGSQLWDTGFATQAIVENGMERHFPEVVRKAYRFIERQQVREEVADRERFFRHISKGAWPFSTRPHGWPISDCTALGLHATLLVHRSGVLEAAGPNPIGRDRLQDAVDVILSLQNPDGGWASYENTRGPAWLELLNPAAIFRDIMIDYSYTECSASCIQALLHYRESDPRYRRGEIDRAIENGLRFVRAKQRQDGSWFGSWGVCFTYGTWFAVEALAAAAKQAGGTAALRADPHLQRACRFLLDRQNGDGGWGEAFQSCLRKEYVPHAKSQIVNTAWVLLSLMAAACPDTAAVRKGIRFLMTRQEENGDWPQEGISGVFNHTCAITYTAYRNVFPIWALGRYFSSYRQDRNH